MKNATIHVISPFHSRLQKEKWSHCAFTQITLKQIQIFKMLGFHVIDYSNWGSESVADEHVEILNRDEFLNNFLDDGRPAHGNAEVGGAAWKLWNDKVLAYFDRYVQSHPESGHNFVAHTFGNSAGQLVTEYPEMMHLETHIGYDRPGFGARRVFVSEAWRNYLFGKYGSTAEDHRWSWAVLPYYDKADWPFVPDSDMRLIPGPTFDGGYIAFLGRMTQDKGLCTVVDVAQRMPHLKFKLAGSGLSHSDFLTIYKPTDNVEFLGEIAGKDRADFLGNTSCLIVPSEYLEPCAGVVCEAALCGTPSVTSSWGGFNETIISGMTGRTASFLGDYIRGIEAAIVMPRNIVRRFAEQRFSLEAAAVQYGRIFERLLTIKGDGWYTMPDRLAQVV